VEEAEDDGAGDAEDEHEEALTKQPFADLALGSFAGAVEAMAFGTGKEGEKEVIGVFAFEHEVDAEEGGCKDVEEVGEPVGEGGEEVSGGGVDGPGGALRKGVDSELVGQGKLLDAAGDLGNALREFVGEVAEVAQNGRKSGGEEERKDGRDGDDEKDDGDSSGGLIAAEFEFGDARDGGHEDDREESTDIKDQELLLEGPGQGKQENDDEDEDDIAAGYGACSLLVRCEVFGRWVGQPDSPGMLTVRCR
jgi:hypothetical protein